LSRKEEAYTYARRTHAHNCK